MGSERISPFKLVWRGGMAVHYGGGHLKFEARDEAAFNETMMRRSALVQAAYKEFHKKWDLQGPETSGRGCQSSSIFSIA
jgi:hypothetical protein